MAKKRKSRPAKANPSASGSKAPASGSKKPAFSLSRRHALKYLGIGAIAIVGAVGIHQYDVKAKTTHDLTAIGSGEPVVVQVHDPSCNLCRQLKRSTETALKQSPDILYRIADLTTDKGREIGQQYGVGKVTLLLFNGAGKHVHTVQGVTPAEELTATFARYL